MYGGGDLTFSLLPTHISCKSSKFNHQMIAKPSGGTDTTARERVTVRDQTVIPMDT